VTLPAFAAERRAAAPLLLSARACYTARLLHGDHRAHMQLSIDISCPQGARWNRQTDEHPTVTYIDPALHTDSVNDDLINTYLIAVQPLLNTCMYTRLVMPM